MSSSLTKPIVPNPGRNNRRIAIKAGMKPWLSNFPHPAFPGRIYPNMAYGKMKRAGVYATRKRS